MSDLISRQAVLDYPIRLDHYDEEHGNRHFVLGIESVMEYVEYLPSAEPKTGKWIEEITGNGWNEWVDLTCDQCGAKFEKAGAWLYCPNCGAKMKGGDDE